MTVNLLELVRGDPGALPVGRRGQLVCPDRSHPLHRYHGRTGRVIAMHADAGGRLTFTVRLAGGVGARTLVHGVPGELFEVDAPG